MQGRGGEGRGREGRGREGRGGEGRGGEGRGGEGRGGEGRGGEVRKVAVLPSIAHCMLGLSVHLHNDFVSSSVPLHCHVLPEWM